VGWFVSTLINGSGALQGILPRFEFSLLMAIDIDHNMYPAINNMRGVICNLPTYLSTDLSRSKIGTGNVLREWCRLPQALFNGGSNDLLFQISL
jgi:hypothetical protein